MIHSQKRFKKNNNMRGRSEFFTPLLVVLFCLTSISPLSGLSQTIPQEEGRYRIDTVINSVRIGSLVGNKNLAFGVKNVAEEALMDLELSVTPNKKDATHNISIEVIYFDIEQVKTNLSFVHKDANITVIRLRGKMELGGKIIKNIIVEEKSSEIALSSFVVSEGGGFNQQSASNALKKACVNLIQKMISGGNEKNKK